MAKPISFANPKFFGPAFNRAYGQFKRERLRELGFIHPMAMMPARAEILTDERHHRAELAILAVQTAKNLFPVADIAGLQFEVEIADEISHSSISEDGTPNEPEDAEELNDEQFAKAAKQKFLNSIGQGAAVSMNTVHHMVPELDKISPTLKENYDILLKANEIFYLTVPEEDFAAMACNSNDDGEVAGTNRVIFKDHVPYVIAKADNFVILVHEIVKGIYTYLALNAYTDEFEYHEISQYTDAIASEIQDIGSGKMILNTLRNYLLDNFSNYYEHECFFEMYYVTLSKMPADELIVLIRGLIDGTPNRTKFETIARNCYHDLKSFEKKRSGY